MADVRDTKSPVVNFLKAVGLVVLAILAIKLFAMVIGAIMGLVLTAIIVLAVGALVFGVFHALKR